MSVQKFRSIEEMNRAPYRRVEGNRFDRFIAHCALYRSLGRVEYRPGVWRYRTLEEAQSARLELRRNRRSDPADGV